MQKILVSGASGFIGAALCQYLVSQSYDVHGIVRNSGGEVGNVTLVELDLERPESFSGSCEGVDCLVHLAGRAHVLNDASENPLEDFRRVNLFASLHLAREAIESRVRRFIFVSSIGVNGSESTSSPFCEGSLPSPNADYAVSKFEAEVELKKLFAGTGTELVIIRPPLVYGAKAPGNFARLIRLVAKGLPMPLGWVKNQRSMVSLDNLVSFISLCIEHPAAKNELFVISDGDDVSTAEIVRFLSLGMGIKPLLIPVPDRLLKLGAKLLGRESLYVQLCRSLRVDSSKARELLGWKPEVGTAEGLIKAGRSFVESGARTN